VPYLNARNEIRDVLAGGASYATINYRLLEEVDDEGIIKSMSDCRRCLQFLRYHHEQLNIDPERIALYGSSAGSGACLWLAFNDDLADPDADDPVLRASTRVNVIGLKATQASYDFYRWETDVFVTLGLTFEDLAGMSYAEADGFRRAMTHDHTDEEMEKMRESFITRLLWAVLGNILSYLENVSLKGAGKTNRSSNMQALLNIIIVK